MTNENTLRILELAGEIKPITIEDIKLLYNISVATDYDTVEIKHLDTLADYTEGCFKSDIDVQVANKYMDKYKTIKLYWFVLLKHPDLSIEDLNMIMTLDITVLEWLVKKCLNRNKYIDDRDDIKLWLKLR